MGHLDLPLLDYAIKTLGGIDQLAVTCLDHRPSFNVGSYRTPSRLAITHDDLVQAHPHYAKIPADRLVPHLANLFTIKTCITSHGPTHTDKQIVETPVYVV